MRHYNKRYIWYLIIISFLSSLFFLIAVISSFVPEDREITIVHLKYCLCTFVGLVIVSIIFSVLTWHFTRYSLTEDAIILKKGIIFKSTKAVPYDKVHAIDFHQNLLHMLLGIKRLAIDSGSTTKAELEEIKIIEDSKNSALLEKEIRSRMKTNTVDITEEIHDESDNTIYRYSHKQKVMVAFIQSLIIIIITLPIFATVCTMSFIVPDPEVENSKFLVLGVTGFIWVFSFIVTYLYNIIKYYNYRVFVQDEYLFINYGFISKYNNTLPLNRIKAIKVEESLIERIFNLSKIKVEVVGFGESTNNNIILNYFIPLCYKKDVNKYISQLGLKYEYNDRDNRAPKRAFKYFYSLRLFIYTIIYLSLLPLVFINKKILLAIIIYLAVYLIIGILIFINALLCYINTGIYIDNDLIIITNGSFNKKSTIILNENITAVEQIDTYCRRQKDIASFKIHYFNNAAKNVEKVHLVAVILKDKLNKIIKY